jgi:hypothetical protein
MWKNEMPGMSFAGHLKLMAQDDEETLSKFRGGEIHSSLSVKKILIYLVRIQCKY